MRSGLSKLATTVMRLILAIAISVSGFNSINAQQNCDPGQVQPNCCSSCRQMPCRCRRAIQFVNPNQFLCEPQRQDQCLPGSESYIYPPSGLDQPYPQDMSGQPDSQFQNQPDSQAFNPLDQGASNANALAFGQGGGGEGMGFNDSIIGDFFGGGGFIAGPSWGPVPITSPLAAGDRRFKLTEHTSPIPTDRVFANYNLFNDALVDVNGSELYLNRYTFGIEKTLFRGNTSVELRVPILDGLDSEQSQISGSLSNRNTEFGNMSLTTKFLLCQNADWAFSTGLGVIFPTANDAVLTSANGFTVDIANEACYLQPFFAIQRTPNPCSWITFYTQCDFAAQGNTVTVTDNSFTLPSEVYNDQHLLFFDLSMGRWLYRDNSNCNRLNGIAAIFEMHYTTTLNDTDLVTAGQYDFRLMQPIDTLSNPSNRLNVLNTTLGLRFLFNERNTLTLAGVAPLRSGDDRLFDSEFSVQFSRSR